MTSSYTTLSEDGLDPKKPTIAVIVNSDRIPMVRLMLEAQKNGADLNNVNIVFADEAIHIADLDVELYAQTPADIDAFTKRGDVPSRWAEPVLDMTSIRMKKTIPCNIGDDKRPGHLKHLGANITSARKRR